MTRIDESVSSQRGRTVRATTAGGRRARFFTRALAACAVMLTASCAAFSADFYGSSSAASAAAKSQYLRARQQEAAQAQYQRQQEALLLQRQAAEAENLRRMEIARRQTAAAEQASAQEGRSSSGSSKGLFSGISNLWDGSRSSSQSQSASQPRQPLLTAPFQQSSQPEPRQEGPERNNAFGYRPLFKRSSLPFSRSHGDQAERSEEPSGYASSQSWRPDHDYAGPQAQYAHSPYRQSPSGTPSAESLAQPSTNRSDAADLLTKIPWNALSPSAKTKIQSLTSSSTLYRRLPMGGCRCNPELFDFFLTYPNTVVELWRSMGYEDITMVDLGNHSYEIREKSGSYGKLQILYQDTEMAVAYCSGAYRGAAFGRQLSGEAFLVLQTRYTEGPDRTPFAVCRMDAFIDLNNPGAEFLARTFSSTIGKIADTNFNQTLAFVDSVSQTIESNPREFMQVAFSLSGLSPDARRLFAAKAERVASQARVRVSGGMPDYQLLAKMNEPNSVYARILSRGDTQTRVVANPAVLPGQGSVLEVPSASAVPALPPSLSESDSSRFAVSSRSTRGLTSGLDKTPDFETSFSSDEFALADDTGDYIGMDEWEDDEAEETTSLAKAGARPSTHLDAMKLLEEQESRAAPSYAANSNDVLSTDELEEIDEFSALNDFTPEEDGDAESIAASDEYDALDAPVAIPSTLAASSKKSSVVASPLNAEEDAEAEEPAEVAEEEPIILLLPEDLSTAPSDGAPALVLPTEEPESAEEPTLDLIAIPADSGDEPEPAAVNAPFTVEVEEEASPAPTVEKPAEKTAAKKTAAPVKDDNWAAGWVPVAASESPLPAVKVAARADEEQTRGATAPKSAWRRAPAEPKEDAQYAKVPARFITRRYARPVEDPKAEPEHGEKTYIPTFDSGAEAASANDAPATFKKPR